MLPTVSIIIPAYNCESYIEETLESAYRQTYDSDKLQVIAINDGSTDSTLSILKELADKYSLIIKSTPNRGASAARELGRQLAIGKYIQYLDSDDLLMPQKIEKQVKLLEATDGDLAYGAYERFKISPTKEYCRLEVKLPKRQYKDLEVDTFKSFWFPPAALLYSKRLTDKIGPWPINLPIIQDARYLQEASILKGKFVFTEGIMAKYRVTENSLSNREGVFKFYKDVFQNGLEIHQKWKSDLTEEKRNAVLGCFTNCARVFVEHDIKLFESCVEQLHQIQPDFIPKGSKIMSYVSRIFGYRRAELIRYNTKKLLEK